jgi:hypothetical protein
MKALPYIAVLLLIVWAVLRLALLVTTGLLHLLWIVALVMIVSAALGKLRGKRT